MNYFFTTLLCVMILMVHSYISAYPSTHVITFLITVTSGCRGAQKPFPQEPTQHHEATKDDCQEEEWGKHDDGVCGREEKRGRKEG